MRGPCIRIERLARYSEIRRGSIKAPTAPDVCWRFCRGNVASATLQGWPGPASSRDLLSCSPCWKSRTASWHGHRRFGGDQFRQLDNRFRHLTHSLLEEMVFEAGRCPARLVFARSTVKASMPCYVYECTHSHACSTLHCTTLQNLPYPTLPCHAVPCTICHRTNTTYNVSLYHIPQHNVA